MMQNIFLKFKVCHHIEDTSGANDFKIKELDDIIIIESDSNEEKIIENQNDLKNSKDLLKSSFIIVDKKDIIQLLEKSQVLSTSQQEFEYILHNLAEKSMNYSFKNLSDIEIHNYAPRISPNDFEFINDVNRISFKLFVPPEDVEKYENLLENKDM